MTENSATELKHRRKAPHWGVLVLIAAAAALAGGYYWTHSAAHETTDDATIESHVLPVSSKVAGQIVEIAVDDNQHVEKGALLARIDPRDYQVKLDQAYAELAAARAEAARAEADAERAKQLYGKDNVSRQVYDKALADAGVMKARSELAEKKLAGAELDLSYTRITAPEAGKVTKKNAELRAFVQVG
ncbi:MAG: efflux RND transporter periplasmic adaptor subunit, partial [Elusimicrobia bacterium]|nr:efflux RND transporter periplasmic adaptor subunit [Elusimicrobiota bacterium]